jgi:hypothetical protein
MRQVTLGYSFGRQKGATYHVDIWDAPWWGLCKAKIFHWIFCDHLLGSWRGWTALGNKFWAPDDFELQGVDYKGKGRWHKSRRMPLYAWGDLHCKLNTGELGRFSGASLKVTPEEYVKLGGTLRDEEK